MNDDERSQWIDNDEVLYLWWKGSRLPKRKFIRENLRMLTQYIQARINRPPQRRTDDTDRI